eukprot:m51a1_g4850 hypothetical protein (382) ;mRNA; f:263673-265301
MAGKLTAINPLAAPKGVRLSCELCGKVAYIQCPGCRATYYCSKDHQSVDWNGIHVKICTIVGTLRTQLTNLGSEEERARRRKATRETQASLVDLTRQEALKFLHEGQYDLAIPAALQSLKFSVDVHGAGALELVPSYLLLGEASIGLGKYGQAESYLSAAKWAVLKNPACPNRIKSSLHRIFGKLYSSSGSHLNYDLALQHLAIDVYFSSLESGPLSFATCGGYFQMASVFMSRGTPDSALAMYDTVVEICLESLQRALDSIDSGSGDYALDEAEQVECQHMLTRIAGIREQLLGMLHKDTGMTQLALGLYYVLTRSGPRAEESLTRAYEVLSDALGQRHSYAQVASRFLDRAAQMAMMEKAAAASRASGSPLLVNTSMPL